MSPDLESSMPDASENQTPSASQATEVRAVQRTLEAAYCPPAIAEARTRQDALLIERFKGQRNRLADIGCGNGYHAILFADSSELYHGFELSTELADKARTSWRSAGLSHADVFVGDVAESALLDEFYDAVLCLYFTPGNLRDKSSDLTMFTDAYLDRNPYFVRVMSRFRSAMRPGGSMFLTVYRDIPETEAAQIDFYEHTGQHVITPRGSRFVATAEGFWSVRWTEESMLSNLTACGFAPDDVTLTELNAISWLVEARNMP
jgi:SAM-dependent methyltransferase